MRILYHRFEDLKIEEEKKMNYEYNESMIYALPRHLKRRIVFVVATGLISFVIAYFIDQYYIWGKGWWFLMEFVN